MQMLALTNLERKQLGLRDAATIAGMAALWMSLFKRLLYPALYTYYRTGNEQLVSSQAVYAVVLVAVAGALAIGHNRLPGALLARRWPTIAAGAAGSIGLVILGTSDFSGGHGLALACAGNALMGIYLPIMAVFWVVFGRTQGASTLARNSALSFALFLATYLLLVALNAQTLAVSIACPAISGLCAAACPRGNSSAGSAADHPSRQAGATDEAHPAIAGATAALPADRTEEEPSPRLAAPQEAVFRNPPPRASAPAAVHSTDVDELQPFGAQFGLSEREVELAAYAYRNFSAKRIAAELFIAESTVYTHLKRIYRKVDVHSKQELIDAIDAWRASN